LKKNKSQVVQALTAEQLIDSAETSFIRSFDRTPIELQPKPTRFFAVGEEVKIGHLKEVFIEKVLFDGMVYVYRCKWSDRDNPAGVISYRAEWWFGIKKFDDNEDVPQLMSQHRIFPAINSDIDSLTNHIYSGGLVIDPRYQRDYVWSEENKDALIESIFEHLDIGSFLLVRHHAFLHEKDESTRQYRTIDGRLVDIKRCEDYTVAIVDGQQRLTTILDFMFDRRPYKGVYFSQLNIRDRREFTNKSVQYRIIDEEQTTDKEILRMFLQANRGVPQSPEHLAKVQAMYDAM
jgi:hypothetical protein